MVKLSGRWPGTKPGLPQDRERHLPSAQEVLSPHTTMLIQICPLWRDKRGYGVSGQTSHVPHQQLKRGHQPGQGTKSNGEGIWQPKITATRLLGFRRDELPPLQV